MKKLLVLVSVLGIFFLAGRMVVRVIKAVDTTLGATITGGSLTLSNSTAASATFVGKSVTTSEQTTTANIGDTDATNTTGIEISDLRGTGVGWAATMTATNLTTQGTVRKLVGSNSTVGFTGVYNGVDAIFTTSGLYTVEIISGGAVGVAVFTWTNPIGVTTPSIITGDSVLLSNGISVTFGAAVYAVGDKWSIAVDALRYNYDTTKGLTVSPSAIHIVSGVTTGMVVGSPTLLTGSGATSGAVTVLTAAADAGMGDYFIDLGLSQTIHPNSYAGTYTSVVTLTVS